MLETFEFDLVNFILFILLALCFVLLNGFFVAAEFALVGVRRSKVEELAQKGSGRAKAVLKMLEHQDTVISATQFGITLASLALGFITGSFFEPLIEEFIHVYFPFLPNTVQILSFTIALSIGAFISLFATTYAHVVLGELVFKSIALQYPDSTSIWVAKPLSWFTKIASPFIKLFNGTAWLILKLFGVTPRTDHLNVHSEDELKLIINQSKAAGVLDEHETEILSRTFDLADTTVREIMTPRTELKLIDVNETFQNILDTILDSGHSRFPVYEDNHDNIIGLIYAKDLLQYFRTILNSEVAPNLDDITESHGFFPNLKEVLREADFVPETMHADKVLEQMQNSKKQVAVVVTEFGGVAGLISLEDVLELLVGDIQDEYDVEPPNILTSEFGDIVNGTISLDDFNDHYETEFESEHSVTFSGFVIENFGKIPDEEESITIDNLLITVKHVTNNRINELLVLRQEKEEEIETTELDKKGDKNGDGDDSE